MEKLLLLTGLLFVTPICWGQQSIIYEFEANHSYKKLMELKEAPLIYSVDEIMYEKEVEVGKIPIVNEEYFFLYSNIKKLAKDSIYYHKKLNAANKRYDDFLKIQNLIGEFVASPEKFDGKKDKLILAQDLANNNELEVLIYADDNNSSEEKLKYFILQIDDKGLNDHLVRISKNIENLFVPLPFSKLKFAVEKLSRFRHAIKGMDKNDYIDGGYKNVESYGIAINNKVDGVKSLHGEFEELGVHYVLNQEYEDLFNKGDIIDKKAANKYCLIEKGYTGSPKILMKQATGEDLYLADFNFVNQYAYSINGRSNNVNSYRNNIVTVK